MLTANEHYQDGERLYAAGQYAGAAAKYRQAIDLATAPGAAADPSLHLYFRGLARSLAPGASNGAALAQHRAAFEAADRRPAPEPVVIRLQLDYSLALMRQRRYTEARAQLGDAAQRLQAAHLESSVAAGMLQILRSDLSYLDGAADDALSLGSSALAIFARAAASSNRMAEAHTSIGNAHMKRKDYRAAVAAYQQALTCRNDNTAHDHYQIAINEGSLGEALVELSQCDDAERHVAQAESLLAQCAPNDNESRDWIRSVKNRLESKRAA